MTETDQWDELAASWDDRDEVRAYADKAFASLELRVPELLAAPALRVLDFGAGTGAMSQRLARSGREVIAIDTSRKMLAALDEKTLPGVTALCLDLTTPTLTDEPLLREPFGLIVASSVCAFVDDFEAVVKLFAGLLAPGGCFVQWDWQHADGASDPEGPGFTGAQVRAAYGTAGLTAVHVDTVFEHEVDGESWPVLIGVARRP